MITKINTSDDVASFAKQLLEERINFHPDTDFREYINLKSRKKTFTDNEALDRNKLMNKCFSVCNKEGIDIYEFMGKIFVKDTPFETIFN